MKNYISLKRWTIKEYNLPIDSESYKAIQELEEREEKLRSIDWWWRRENRDLKCMILCIKAILEIPKWTELWNDFTDKTYNKTQAIDYIMNYWIKY